MKVRAALRVFAIVIMLAGLLLPASRAHAAGMVGTGTPGSCTEAAFNAALSGGGTVTFNCGPAPFILFLTLTKTINVDVTIDGGGLVTLDGAGFISLFSVPTGHSLTLKNLTLSHARSSFYGGAILNAGTLAIVNSTFFANTAGTSAGSGGGAVTNDGTMTVTNGSFIDNSVATGSYGGAIQSNSKLTITGGYFAGNGAPNGFGGAIYAGSPAAISASYFTGNQAGDGGAIQAPVTGLTVTTSTFYRNSATSIGGAIQGQAVVATASTFDTNSAPIGGAISTGAGTSISQSTFIDNEATSGYGGAFNNDGGPNTVTNSTFNGNFAATAGGAIYDNPGSILAINNSTIAASASGYGLDNSGTTTLTNTILSGNMPDNCTGPAVPTSGGHNLDSLHSCNLSGAGDISGVNPLLGPLANNGGPTQTMSLLAGSPAIDHGSNTTCAPKDQRGVIRPQGGICDIGAYEVKVATFISQGAYDGLVLESGKGTGMGGSLNSTASTLAVGDDASNRRYRGFLSFNTSTLPDGATVILAEVMVKKQALVGKPFSTQGTLVADLAKPYFGAGPSLAISDWQASATVAAVTTFGAPSSAGWYAGLLNSSGRLSINKLGSTQFRLRFTSDLYNGIADYLSVYSGNSTSYRPRLIVYYNP